MNKKILFLCVAAIMLFSGCGKTKEQIDFDSETWKTMDFEERYRMLDSLTENYELVGMTEEEIQDLLGEYVKAEPTMNESASESEIYYTVRYDEMEGDCALLFHLEDGVVTEYETDVWEWTLN